jgi:hypothetical protein
VIEMAQLEPAGSVAPHVFAETAKSAGFAPTIETPPIFKTALPVLESVRDIGALVVPSVTLPNAADAGVSEATGVGGAVPVPLSVAVCGEPAALSATDSIAAKLAAEAGVKVM